MSRHPGPRPAAPSNSNYRASRPWPFNAQTRHFLVTSGTRQDVGVSRFAMRVEETLPDLDGFEGVVLAGPVTDDGYNLAVGDDVLVPTAAGDVRCKCTGFPLANWGPRHFLTITVTGVRHQDVEKGSLAHAGSDE